MKNSAVYVREEASECGMVWYLVLNIATKCCYSPGTGRLSARKGSGNGGLGI